MLVGDDLMEPAVDTEGWIETAEWYQQTFGERPAARGVAPEQIPDMFINGQVGFIYGGLPLMRRYDNAAGPISASLPCRISPAARKSPTGSWAIGVSPYTDEPEAALEFARFVSFDKEGAIDAGQPGPSAVPVPRMSTPIT